MIPGSTGESTMEKILRLSKELNLGAKRPVDDYIEVPSPEQLSKIVLAENFTICQEILCILPRNQLKFVKPHGSLQAVISLLSFLGKQTGPLILKFIDEFKPKVTILHKDMHYLENVFQLFESNPETVEKTTPEGRALRIKYMINSNSMEECSNVIHFYICIFALSMGACLDSEKEYKIWYERQRKSFGEIFKFNVPLDKFIPFHIVDQFSVSVGIIPEFRSLMINVLVASKDEKGVVNILNMLEFSQMKNVKFIEIFLDAPQKTRAHFHRIVVEDMKSYIKNRDDTIYKYGADKWKYFKLFEPRSSLFSIRELRYLSYAAYMLAEKEYRAEFYGIPQRAAEILKAMIKTPFGSPISTQR